MAVNESSRPLVSAITRVASDFAYLLQTEIGLARAEIGEKLSSAANGAVFVGVAAVLLLSGLVVLQLAVVHWLEFAGLSVQWAYTIVGVVVVFAGIVLALIGANRFKGSALVPNRTIEQVRADYTAVKERVG